MKDLTNRQSRSAGDPSRVLLVDLNNFSRYPTLSIGYLTAVLRGTGNEVHLFSPLMLGVAGVTRESRHHFLTHAIAQLNHRLATNRHRWLRQWRDRLAGNRRSPISSQRSAIVRRFSEELRRLAPHAVLVSTYLMYKDVCEDIGAECGKAGVPLLIGGPYFVQRDTIQEWLGIEGISAIAAGEIELLVPGIIEAMRHGEDLVRYDGLFTQDSKGRPKGNVAPPLRGLDAIPFPDYSDFPWPPNERIVPIITGRGCGWAQCTFCSDIESVNGRTYRSRSIENVLAEIAYHRERYGASHFVFTDLKLNSNPAMWRAISAEMQRVGPGAKWIASVHVGTLGDSGLSETDLHAAAASGCVRLTTGLETASQRLSDLMRKGTKVANISKFLKDATAAGISCRCTMILGYPGESAADVDVSRQFLEHHYGLIERVMVNRLQLIAGTHLYNMIQERPKRFPDMRVLDRDKASSTATHHYLGTERPSYRSAVTKLLTAAHRINSQQLAPRARVFEGVM